MEPNPDYRYADAAAMRADLDLVLSQPMAKVEAGERTGAVAAAVPVTSSVKGRKAAKENSTLPVYLGVGLATTVVIGIVVLATRGTKEEERSAGTPARTKAPTVVATTIVEDAGKSARHSLRLGNQRRALREQPRHEVRSRAGDGRALLPP